MARFDINLNVADVFADLDEIDRVIPQQVQDHLGRTAQQYMSRARAITPIGKPRKGRRSLVSGWSVSQRGLFSFHVVNRRPHAHLVARGFTHVGGKQVAATAPFIPLAQEMRADMVRDLTRVVGPGFRGRLRALEMSP